MRIKPWCGSCGSCSGGCGCEAETEIWETPVTELLSVEEADRNKLYITPDERLWILNYKGDKLIEIERKNITIVSKDGSIQVEKNGLTYNIQVSKENLGKISKEIDDKVAKSAKDTKDQVSKEIDDKVSKSEKETSDKITDLETKLPRQVEDNTNHLRYNDSKTLWSAQGAWMPWYNYQGSEPESEVLLSNIKTRLGNSDGLVNRPDDDKWENNNIFSINQIDKISGDLAKKHIEKDPAYGWAIEQFEMLFGVKDGLITHIGKKVKFIGDIKSPQGKAQILWSKIDGQTKTLKVLSINDDDKKVEIELDGEVFTYENLAVNGQGTNVLRRAIEKKEIITLYHSENMPYDIWASFNTFDTRSAHGNITAIRLSIRNKQILGIATALEFTSEDKSVTIKKKLTGTDTTKLAGFDLSINKEIIPKINGWANADSLRIKEDNSFINESASQYWHYYEGVNPENTIRLDTIFGRIGAPDGKANIADPNNGTKVGNMFSLNQLEPVGTYPKPDETKPAYHWAIENVEIIFASNKAGQVTHVGKKTRFIGSEVSPDAKMQISWTPFDFTKKVKLINISNDFSTVDIEVDGEVMTGFRNISINRQSNSVLNTLLTYPRIFQLYPSQSAKGNSENWESLQLVTSGLTHGSYPTIHINFTDRTIRGQDPRMYLTSSDKSINIKAMLSGADFTKDAGFDITIKK